jgi:hypothetical protein
VKLKINVSTQMRACFDLEYALPHHDTYLAQCSYKFAARLSFWDFPKGRQGRIVIRRRHLIVEFIDDNGQTT